jgi:hypothetical protein
VCDARQRGLCTTGLFDDVHGGSLLAVEGWTLGASDGCQCDESRRQVDDAPKPYRLEGGIGPDA